MEYEKCLVQVYEILNHLDEEELYKIPEIVIKKIEDKKDKNYIWIYDETKDLKNQEIDRKTIAILSYINLEYLLNEEEKDILIKMHEFNEEKLFPKVRIVNFNNNIKHELPKGTEHTNADAGLVKAINQKWYKKIWKQIKQLFNR